MRKRPGEKHSLTKKQKTRGEKVEIVHNQLGDFANAGMRGEGAQALTLEGLVRYLMDRQQERLWNSELSERDTVTHYRRWLKEEANDLARIVGHDAPYPEVEPLAANTGEKFLRDYYIEQLEREKEPSWKQAVEDRETKKIPILRCPCSACITRRRDCMCQACTVWRKEVAPAPVAAPTPTIPVASPQAVLAQAAPAIPPAPIVPIVPIAVKPKSKRSRDARTLPCDCRASDRRDAIVQEMRQAGADNEAIKKEAKKKLKIADHSDSCISHQERQERADARKASKAHKTTSAGASCAVTPAATEQPRL